MLNLSRLIDSKTQKTTETIKDATKLKLVCWVSSIPNSLKIILILIPSTKSTQSTINTVSFLSHTISSKLVYHCMSITLFCSVQHAIDNSVIFLLFILLYLYMWPEVRCILTNYYITTIYLNNNTYFDINQKYYVLLWWLFLDPAWFCRRVQ